MSELAVALLGALRIGLPGWVWSIPGAATPATARTAGAVFSHAGRAIALGLVLNLLPALCVAQQHGWSPKLDWGLWVGVLLAGLVRLAWRRRSSFSGAMADAAWVIGFLALVTIAVLWRAPRSEWFAGWIPGCTRMPPSWLRVPADSAHGPTACMERSPRKSDRCSGLKLSRRFQLMPKRVPSSTISSS
jgi:hypothetical protein